MNANLGTRLNPVGNGLRVEIRVIATDYTALAFNSWPEYIFSDDYELKSLDEVKDFITKNNHLPNIPNAKEIEKNHIFLRDMIKSLIKKIEVLSLDVIQLNGQKVML